MRRNPSMTALRSLFHESRHDFGRAQSLDLFGRETKKVPQDLVGMLSENRGCSGNRLRVARKLDGPIHDGDFSKNLMVRLDHDFPRHGLRLRERLLDPQYGRMRNLMFCEQL